MKNRRINLFLGKKDYQDIQKYLYSFRLVLVGASFLFCLFVAGISYLIFLQGQEINKKTVEKKNNLQLFQSQKEKEVKLIKIANKTKDFDIFIQNDAQFYPYYKKFVDAINKSEEVPTVDSLSIEKDRNFKFSLSFLTKEGLLKTFQFIESDDFLKNFQEIYLKNVETKKDEKGEIYNISFEGKFNKINENTN